METGRFNKLIKTIVLVSAALFCAYTAFTQGTIEHKYWPDGKLRLTKACDSLGDLREESFYRQDGSIEQHIKYDMDGRKIEESYYDEHGNLEEGVDGWAAMRIHYKGGVERQESYYGADGKLKERKQFNSSGDLVSKQYVGDGDLLPAEEYNPVPPITGYETDSYYDSYGRPEGTTTIDRDPEWWGWPFWPDDY